MISKEFDGVQFPASAVDVLVFTIKGNDLLVGLVKRTTEPYKNSFVLPGRFVRYDEPVEQTAGFVLEQKAGLHSSDITLEQLYTFGQDLDRDSRVRTITITYYGILPQNKFLDGKVSWFSVHKLPKMGFDHKKIVRYAVERLQNKVHWDEFAFLFLPKKFTLTELQQVYEVVLDKELDKRNFRKKIKEIKGLKRTSEKKSDGVQRPAALYVFESEKKSMF